MVDLDNLSDDETSFVHQFLDRLMMHGRVMSSDFPEMNPDRFDQLANAIMTEMNRQELH